MFAADLLRALHRAGLEPQVEFFHLSSYLEGTVSTGTVKILRDIESSVRDRDVLLVDDILESGRTLAFAKDLLTARGARRVLVCTMLEKPGKRAVQIVGRFRRFCLPRPVRRRLWHGRRPFLSRTAVHRPCRHRRGRRLTPRAPRALVFESQFQSFAELGGPAHGAARVADLRAELERARSRRLHRSARRRASERICAARTPSGCCWLTGFSGSAGLAIVLQDKAALFVDGRYTRAGARADRRADFRSLRTSSTSRRTLGSRAI